MTNIDHTIRPPSQQNINCICIIKLKINFPPSTLLVATNTFIVWSFSLFGFWSRTHRLHGPTCEIEISEMSLLSSNKWAFVYIKRHSQGIKGTNSCFPIKYSFYTWMFPFTYRFSNGFYFGMTDVSSVYACMWKKTYLCLLQLRCLQIGHEHDAATQNWLDFARFCFFVRYYIIYSWIPFLCTVSFINLMQNLILSHGHWR